MTLELATWRGARVPVLSNEVSRSFGIDQYIQAVLAGQSYMGPPMPVTLYGNRPAEQISISFEGYTCGMLYQDGPVATVEAYRLGVFGQAPLLFQEMTDGRPGGFYDDEVLDRLRAPWPGGTLTDLAKRGLMYGDLAGNCFVADLEDELVLLRPDWVEIVLEKRMHRGGQVGWRQVGILYYEGGYRTNDGVPFLPGEYAHFVPGLPDPLATYRGMSWLTPLVREVKADKAAGDHKVAWFENSASVNVAVSLPKEITSEQFSAFVDKMDSQHRGPQNAGKTLYTGGGADVTVIGANMQQADFASIVGKGENRIANAGRVPAVLLGFSEGLSGSSLNAGNYTAAKRNFVDTTCRDLWGNWAGSLQQMEAFKPPKKASRLWYDGRDIPFLHEDALDLAQIQQARMTTINTGVTAGFVPDTVVAAVVHDDMTLLEHTGLTSVQLSPPGGPGEPADPLGAGPVSPSGDSAGTPSPTGDETPQPDADGEIPYLGRSFALDDDDVIDRAHVLLNDRLLDSLTDWLKGVGEKDPLAQGWDREQLRELAKRRGLYHRHMPLVELKRVLYQAVRDEAEHGSRSEMFSDDEVLRHRGHSVSGETRVGAGDVHGGRFGSTLGGRLEEWVKGGGKGDENALFEGMSRDAIKGQAKAHGVTVTPRMSLPVLKSALLAKALENGPDHAAFKGEPKPRAVPQAASAQKFFAATVGGKDVQVGIWQNPTSGKLSVYATQDGKKSGRALGSFDDMHSLADWADGKGGSKDLADYARDQAGPDERPKVPAKKAAPVKAAKKAADKAVPAEKTPPPKHELTTQDELVEGHEPDHIGTLRDQLHALAGKRIAERWDVTPEDFDELVRAEDSWDPEAASARYKAMPFDEAKAKFAAGQAWTWDSGAGKPTAVLALMEGSRLSGSDPKLSDDEEHYAAYAAARPGLDRATKALGAAMYGVTQDWFKERGITHVDAKRYTLRPGDENQNLYGSWSLRGMGGFWQRTEEHSEVQESIPVSRVFSIPPTGFGNPDESELVVLAASPDAEKAESKTSPSLDDLRGMGRSERQAALSKMKAKDLRDLGKDADVPLHPGAPKAEMVEELDHGLAKQAVKGTAAHAPDAVEASGLRFDLARTAAVQGVSDEQLAQVRELIRVHQPRTLLGQEETGLAGLKGLRDQSPELAQFYIDHPDIYNRLVQEQSIDRAWTTMHAGDTDEAKARADRALRDALKPASPVAVRTSSESALRGILESGRIKSQFETGTSAGYEDLKLREDLEAMTFGLSRKLPADQRPIYGYVAVGGIDKDTGEGLEQYGDIRMVLKGDVRARTTVSVGDSLDNRDRLTPMPIDHADWHAVKPSLANSDLESERFRDAAYVEAQVQGGVKSSDIAEVVFGTQPEPETVAALERSGISWRVLAKSGDEKAPKAAKDAETAAATIDELDDPVLKARAEGAKFEHAKGIASTLAEVEQLVHNGTSDRGLDHRLDASAHNHDLPPEMVERLRTAAKTGRRADLEAAVTSIAAENGLKRTSGPAGSVEAFDRRIHEPIGASADYSGATKVRVLSPAYSVQGHPTIRAAVQEATPGDIAEAAEGQAGRDARNRQARIDKARPAADTLAELSELHGNEADPEVIAERLRKTGAGVQPSLLKDLIAAGQSGDRKRIDEVSDRVAQQYGLTRISGPAGAVEPYDPTMHKAIGGGVKAGDPVQVVRPVYGYDPGDGRVNLGKAAVEKVDEPTPAPKVAKKAVPRVPATEAGKAKPVQFPLAPGYKGALGRKRQAQREEVLTAVHGAGPEGLGFQGDYREHAESLESAGYLRRDASGRFKLTDKGREYLGASAPAAAPKAVPKVPATKDGKATPDTREVAQTGHVALDAQARAGWKPGDVVVHRNRGEGVYLGPDEQDASGVGSPSGAQWVKFANSAPGMVSADQLAGYVPPTAATRKAQLARRDHTFPIAMLRNSEDRAGAAARLRGYDDEILEGIATQLGVRFEPGTKRAALTELALANLGFPNPKSTPKAGKATLSDIRSAATREDAEPPPGIAPALDRLLKQAGGGRAGGPEPESPLDYAAARIRQARGEAPETPKPERKLTARDVASMTPDDVAKAHLEGRVTARIASDRIRFVAEYRATSAALMPEAPERDQLRVESERLYALADGIAPPRSPRGRARGGVPSVRPAAEVAAKPRVEGVPETSVVREQLARMNSEDDARAYLDGLNLSAAQMKQLATDLNARPLRNTKAGAVDSIVKVHISGRAVTDALGGRPRSAILDEVGHGDGEPDRSNPRASSTLIVPTPTPPNPKSPWGQIRDDPTVTWSPTHGRPGNYDQIDRVYTAPTRAEARKFLEYVAPERLQGMGDTVEDFVDLRGLDPERDKAAYIDRLLDGIREPEVGHGDTPNVDATPTDSAKIAAIRTDTDRQLGEMGREIEEDLGKDASTRALTHRIRARMKRLRLEPNADGTRYTWHRPGGDVEIEPGLPGRPPTTAEEADLDAARKLATVASEVDRLSNSRASKEEISTRLRDRLAGLGVELHGGRVGDTVPFDPSEHEPLGPVPARGTPVAIVRPGARTRDALIERPLVQDQGPATPNPDDPARQAEVEAAVRKAAPKLSTAPVIPNTWGGGTGRDGEVSFHPDGEIGRALTSMGDEDRVEVDGQPLRNVVGLIATDAQRGRKTPQETVDALKTVRDKLPEGRAKTALSGAISAIDAPPRRVDLPAGTSQALVDLMDRFADNPLARRDVDQFGRAEPNEMDRLAALAQRYAGKPISRAMIDDVRRDLFNRRHESVEFKAQLDRDVQKALADLDEERKTPRTASPTATYASRSASVQALSAQTPTAIRGLGGGTSRTTLREYPDGSKLVHKDQLRSATGQDAKGLTDAEVLGSLVLNATGVHAPATHRTGPSDVDMEWIPGKTGSEILGASGAGSPGPEFVDSRDGRLMGLADALMLNPDRQPGNWLVGDDGRLSGIDHGFGFEFQTPEAAAVNPFARHFITERPTSHDQDTWAPTNDMSPLDMAVIRERLEALRPQFEAAGRGNWWSAMMQRMDILSAAAQGTESRNP